MEGTKVGAGIADVLLCGSGGVNAEVECMRCLEDDGKVKVFA